VHYKTIIFIVIIIFAIVIILSIIIIIIIIIVDACPPLQRAGVINTPPTHPPFN
jgi:ABC-type phosphate transport system permease subunit